MCGIVGVVGPAAAGRDAALDRGIAALHHRGPDGHGRFTGDRLALGHTRLAIIDRRTVSDQPMTDTDTGSVLVFNGEIYNYRELRTELEGAGHRFRSNGDTEVLLLAYREWGTACLEHLNGMFAFALWDPRQRSVFLARDRFGEKPLLLARQGTAVWFASEAKALFAAGAATAGASSTGLFRFLAFGDLGHPTETVFEGITSLAPGHAAIVDLDGSMRTWRYWSVPDTPAADLPADRLAAALDRISDAWDDAVRIRLRSDVPVGTSLSGGLDSSAVIATVRRFRPEGELHAFTASFPGSELDELPLARAIADKVGATLHPVPLHAADLADDLDAMCWSIESPVEASSQFAQYRVMRAAHDAGVVVLLDGQGADEVFGGYDKYAGAVVADHLLTGRPVDAWHDERAWRNVHGQVLTPPLGRYLGGLGRGRALTAATSLALNGRWLAAPLRAEHRNVDPLGGDPHDRARPGSVAAALMRQDLTRWTLPRLLHYGDRNSMAWSREVRLPFLDHQLVELAMAIPAAQRVADGWTKEPVRHVLRGLGLVEVAERRDKKGYMPPQQQWLTAPEVEPRVREAWADLHRRGLLSSAEPDDVPLHRWRALSVHAWAARFGVSLGG